MDYKLAHTHESIGKLGEFGLRIYVSINRELTDGEKTIMNQAGNQIMGKLLENSIKADPQSMEHAAKEKKDLLACFPEPVYVKEITNGYCSAPCCAHRPWFIVTTKVGPITIGWRKRVIVVDWSKSDVTKDAWDLFGKEDTTKEGRMIHAWGYDKAKEYVVAILNNA